VKAEHWHHQVSKVVLESEDERPVELAAIGKIEAVTGLQVRSAPRLPQETSPHPDVDCLAAVPAPANLVAKLALGIADNQARPTSVRQSAALSTRRRVSTSQRSTRLPAWLGTSHRRTCWRWCPPRLRRRRVAPPHTP